MTLRIERVGPDEIHWTIIGLPELIRGNKKKRKEHVLNTNGDGARRYVKAGECSSSDPARRYLPR